ncbi:hypothetical protein CR969_01170 [Candidatus Saccharibacteria bacterium]|nr:MAG: hypothetical protein CR969_01170 [Candidatus Saccharibacteria bacterium]
MASGRDSLIEYLSGKVRRQAAGPYTASAQRVKDLEGLFSRTRDAIESERAIVLLLESVSVRGKVLKDTLELKGEIGDRRVTLLPCYVGQAKDQIRIRGYRLGRFSEDENRFASRLTNPCEVTIWLDDGFVRFSDDAKSSICRDN